ncbi:unnamed protein product [Nesidiocoris tenuis]|uniref:Uncharacterized protein n=1 Tax=Nesidiocoris tenuis TaxID=355587 RepID=A0A6H5HF49_9HEMI|nr:unnamed protein product [Nesidiocoris tenuis]
MLTNTSEPSANTRVVYCKGLAARGRTTVSSSLMDPTFGYARCTEWKESSSLILMKQSVFVDESELIARLIYAYLEPPLLPVLFLFVWLLKGTMLKNYLALDKHVLSERKLAEFYPKSILLHFGGIVLTSILLVFNQINRNYLNVLVDYKFLILVVQLLSISMQVSWILRIATKSLETIYDNLALVEDPSYADIRRTIKTHEFTTDVLESFVEGYGPLILITTPLCLMEITAICSVVIYNIQHGYILKVLIDLCWLTLLALTVGEMINACMEASQQKTLTFTACKCFNIDYRLGCSRKQPKSSFCWINEVVPGVPCHSQGDGYCSIIVSYCCYIATDCLTYLSYRSTGSNELRAYLPH